MALNGLLDLLRTDLVKGIRATATNSLDGSISSIFTHGLMA